MCVEVAPSNSSHVVAPDSDWAGLGFDSEARCHVPHQELIRQSSQSRLTFPLFSCSALSGCYPQVHSTAIPPQQQPLSRSGLGTQLDIIRLFTRPPSHPRCTPSGPSRR